MQVAAIGTGHLIRFTNAPYQPNLFLSVSLLHESINNIIHRSDKF